LTGTPPQGAFTHWFEVLLRIIHEGFKAFCHQEAHGYWMSFFEICVFARQFEPPITALL
jgi:hypothetical protein